MNYINSIFAGSNKETDIVISESKSAVNPTSVFFMDRNDVPSSFEMTEMEDGNAPYMPENKAYKKPTKAEKKSKGVRFGENMRKFFDNTEPVTSISQRVKVRNAEPPTQHIGRQLSRSRSLSDSLSELSDINEGNSSDRFRSVSNPHPVTEISSRSPSPVGSPTTITEYNAQIKKDDHEKELALALMRRPSSPDTGWYGGNRSANRSAKRNRNRSAKRNKNRSAKRNRNRSAKRNRNRSAKRNRNRSAKRNRNRSAKRNRNRSAKRTR